MSRSSLRGKLRDLSGTDDDADASEDLEAETGVNDAPEPKLPTDPPF